MFAAETVRSGEPRTNHKMAGGVSAGWNQNCRSGTAATWDKVWFLARCPDIARMALP